jgi:hypothetical protein
MNDIPNEILFNIIEFTNLKSLKILTLINKQIKSCSDYTNLKRLNHFFVTVMKKVCHPELPICETPLLMKLYNDSLVVLSEMKSIESIESKIILINEAKLMLEHRSVVQSTFCFLINWKAKGVNLFNRLRICLKSLLNSSSVRNLCDFLDKRHYLKRLQDVEKFRNCFSFRNHDEYKIIRVTQFINDKTTLQDFENLKYLHCGQNCIQHFLSKNFSGSLELLAKIEKTQIQYGWYNLINLVDTQEELDAIMKIERFQNDNVTPLVESLFPFPHFKNQIFWFLPLADSLSSELSLAIQQIRVTFPNIIHHIDNFLMSPDNRNTLLSKYNRLMKFFVMFQSDGDVIEILLEALTMKIEEFDEKWVDSRSNITQVLMLFTKDDQILTHLEFDLKRNYYTPNLMILIASEILKVSQNLAHYQKLSEFIFQKLPRNFNINSKAPFRCVNRNLVPLVKKLTSIEKIERAQKNLIFYNENFHNIKQVHRSWVIALIGKLHLDNFIQRYTTKLNTILLYRLAHIRMLRSEWKKYLIQIHEGKLIQISKHHRYQR